MRFLLRVVKASFNHEQVIQIAKDLCDKGHTEIVLTIIHTGRYDDGEYDLAKLIKALLENAQDSVLYIFKYQKLQKSVMH